MTYDQLLESHEEHHRQEGTELDMCDLMSMTLNWDRRNGTDPSYTELRNNWELHRRLRALDQRGRDRRNQS